MIPAGVRRQPQDAFVRERTQAWSALDQLLARGQRLDRLTPAEISSFAALHRVVCADLMRARAAGYGRDLVGYLDSLAARAHNALYRSPPYRLRAVVELVTRTFPRTLRESGRFMLAALALFGIPLVIAFFGALTSEEFATGVAPREMLEEILKEEEESIDWHETQLHLINELGKENYLAEQLHG